jgi:hypothetical protein
MKKTKVLSFIGGCVFFSILVGVLLTRNDKLRKEVEEQARGVLNVSREFLRHAQTIVGGVGAMAGTPKIAKKSSNIEEDEKSPQRSPRDPYDDLWRHAETQNAAQVKSRLSR